MKRLLVIAGCLWAFSLPAYANFTQLAHTGASSSNTTSVATTGINTTTATLIVVAISGFYDTGTPASCTLTDSVGGMGNAWTALTRRVASDGTAVQLYYTFPANKGMGHTFSCSSGTATYPGIAVTAWSGSTATPHLVTEAGAGSSTNVTNIQAGAVTPLAANQLILSAISHIDVGATVTVNSGLTLIDDMHFMSGNAFGVTTASILNPALTATNPTWTVTTSHGLAAANVIFDDTPPGPPSTYTAATCNRVDVNAIINGPTHFAVDGDIIVIPAGTCNWNTAGISVPTGMGITITGVGTPDNSATTFLPSSTCATNTILNISGSIIAFGASPTTSSSKFRLSCMTLHAAGEAMGLYMAGQCSSVIPDCPGARIDNIKWTSWGTVNHMANSYGINAIGDIFGVLDHNDIDNTDGGGVYSHFVSVNHGQFLGVGGNGDNSWAAPDYYGTKRFLVFENNTFRDAGCCENEGLGGAGGPGGMRAVVRFNIFQNPSQANFSVGWHEMRGRNRGGRNVEYYRNTWNCNTGATCAAPIAIRGGTALQWGNTFFIGPTSYLATIMDTVSARFFGALSGIGACDGTQPWDNNEATTYYSGTVASVSGRVVTVTGTPSWTTDQWRSVGSPYSFRDTPQNSGTEIWNNTANTLTLAPASGLPGGAWVVTAGDAFQIRRATACLDANMRGAGRLYTGSDVNSAPTPALSADQVIAPVYSFLNSFTGKTDCISGACYISTASLRLIGGRDYFLEDTNQAAQSNATTPWNGIAAPYIGHGSRTNRPLSCTAGVVYWSTDQGSWNASGSGGQGVLDTCTSTNNWTNATYVPYAYPHSLVDADTTPPLVGGGGTITTAAVAQTTLTLNWTKGTDAVTTQALLQYEVCQSATNNITSVANCEANGTIIRSFIADIGTFNVTGLSASTSYFFNVVVRDVAGNKTAYTPVNVTTADIPDVTPPVAGASGVLTTAAITTTTLTLNWTKATDAVSAQALLQYEVCQSATNNISTFANCEANGTIIRTFTADIATFNVTGLSASTAYFFNVVVRDVAGNKTAYVATTATTNAVPDVTPPLVGGGGTITTAAILTTTLTLNWTRATDAVTAQAALQYEVCQSTTNNITTVANCEAGTVIRAFIADIATFNVTGLTPSTPYFFNVVVRDAAGNKTAYTPVTATTANVPDVTPPLAGASGAITTAAITSTTLTLNWTKATDAVTTQALLEYEVCRSATNNISTFANCETNGVIIRAFIADINTLNVTGLTAATAYFFNVVVRDAAGNKTAYTAVTATTDATPDAPPLVGGFGAIATASIATTTLTLNWVKATDVVTAQAALQYEVCRSAVNNITTAADCEANGTIIRAFIADIATLNVTGLTAATGYFFNVVVRDGAGNKTAYVSVGATTAMDVIPDTTPPLAGNTGILTITNLAPNSLRLDWTKANDAISAQPTLQYEVCRSATNNIATVANCEANGVIIRSFIADIATFNAVGLTGSTAYFFNVVARDEAGNKIAYAPVTATTPPDAPPVAPSVIGLPVWADSFNGVHSWFDIGPSGVNCADMVAIAARYDFQYSGSCGAQFRQGNPSFITAIYQDGSQALNVSGCSDAACNLAWWRANHPDWLLYQDNETANPTTVLRTYSYQAINPDFTNPGYRSFRWSQIAPVAATVTQALGYDNLLLDNNFPDITDNNYVQAKGVYPSATAANPTAPPFNPLFVGQGSYADVLDPPFTTGRIQWAAYLRDQQHALPRPLLMILNSDMKIIFNSPTHRAALIASVDGVLTQGGGLAPEYVGDSRQIWLGTMRFIEDMNAAGKAVYQELVQPGHRYEADLEPNWIRFTLASYLLAKGHAAALRLNSDEGGKCPTCTETSGLSWPVEFEATHNGTGVTGAVGIGAPCSAMRVIAGDSDSENALFMREYTHGVVIVNGSLTATYSAASLPSGAWTYKDIYNSAVTAPFNVGPVVMQPFTDWRGHIQQRYVSDASKILLKTGAASDLVCSNGSIDTTPPALVSGPAAGAIAASSAAIGWITDELASGQVDYGLTAAYTASTTLDSTLAAAHTMSIGGLTPSTTYHYRVKSADVWGNLFVSGDFAFNTTSTGGPLQITTASLPNGTKNAPYAQTLAAAGGNPSGSGFGFMRTLTLPRPNTSMVNFPHWFCRQAPEWRTVANGGKVQSPFGHDLVFFPNTTLAAKLDFVKYSYDAATGQWCGRIRIPAFGSGADTVIVAAYGNPSINASQENQTGTFDAPIVAHWSMDSLGDSTASPADLQTSATQPTLGPAKVANGFTLGVSLWLRSSSATKLTQTGPMTLCVWGKYTAALTDSLLVALGTGANYGMYAGDTVAGRPSFFVTQSGALRRATSSVARNDGLHHLFCGGYNNANALLNIDGGAEQVTGAAVAGTLSTDPAPMMTFGNVSSFGAPWCATCQVDEAFLYSQWMGPDWIRAMYLADSTPAAVTIGPETPGPGGGYTFSIAAGALPAGLTLTGATINGMPTTPGVATFTARVTDSTASSDKPFTITINDVIGVTTVALPAGVIHQPYNQIFSASGGTPPFAWALQKGALPPGLTITPVGLSTLKFGGTLSAHGFYVFTVRATDAAGAIEDHRYQMFVGSVTGINYSPLDIHWDFASGNVVVRYSYDCTVYDAATPALNASAGSTAVLLPRSATLCLKLDSSTELDVDVPSANISGFYLK